MLLLKAVGVLPGIATEASSSPLWTCIYFVGWELEVLFSHALNDY